MFVPSVDVLIILCWAGKSVNTETLDYQTSFSIALLYVNCIVNSQWHWCKPFLIRITKLYIMSFSSLFIFMFIVLLFRYRT